jgi:hypothetical protein
VLRRHARVGRCLASWLDVSALGLLRRRGASILLLRLRICHRVLLELGLVGVLVDRGLAALVNIWAGALGILVHGYFILC